MRDLDECSGPWIGWWIQWGRRGHMRLTLNFSNGRIRGSGTDDSGAYEVIGEYGGESVKMAKAYGTHVVLYDGRWNGASIAGRGEVPFDVIVNTSEFEMWPEHESVSIEEILARADEAIERRDLIPTGKREQATN